MQDTISSTMSLIDGYKVYSSAEELAVFDDQQAPAISPVVISFLTASSPECIAFSISAVGGGIVTTFAAGC